MRGGTRSNVKQRRATSEFWRGLFVIDFAHAKPPLHSFPANVTLYKLQRKNRLLCRQQQLQCSCVLRFESICSSGFLYFLKTLDIVVIFGCSL